MPRSPTSFVPAASFTVQYWAVPHCPTCLNDMLASGHLISIKKIRKINSGEISLQKKETKAGVEPKTQCATKEPLPQTPSNNLYNHFKWFQCSVSWSLFSGLHTHTEWHCRWISEILQATGIALENCQVLETIHSANTIGAPSWRLLKCDLLYWLANWEVVTAVAGYNSTKIQLLLLP